MVAATLDPVISSVPRVPRLNRGKGGVILEIDSRSPGPDHPHDSQLSDLWL